MPSSGAASVSLTFPSVPGRDDPLFAEHFDGTERHEIRLPYCSFCERFHWYPMVRCPHCGNSGWTWQRIRPTGRLFTWTVLRRALDPELTSLVGRAVALVVPDDAPNVRLVANLVDVDDPWIDMPVVARFVEVGDVVVPVFAATQEEVTIDDR